MVTGVATPRQSSDSESMACQCEDQCLIPGTLHVVSKVALGQYSDCPYHYRSTTA